MRSSFTLGLMLFINIFHPTASSPTPGIPLYVSSEYPTYPMRESKAFQDVPLERYQVSRIMSFVFDLLTITGHYNARVDLPHRRASSPFLELVKQHDSPLFLEHPTYQYVLAGDAEQHAGFWRALEDGLRMEYTTIIMLVKHAVLKESQTPSAGGSKIFPDPSIVLGREFTNRDPVVTTTTWRQVRNLLIRLERKLRYANRVDNDSDNNENGRLFEAEWKTQLAGNRRRERGIEVIERVGDLDLIQQQHPYRDIVFRDEAGRPGIRRVGTS